MSLEQNDMDEAFKSLKLVEVLYCIVLYCIVLYISQLYAHHILGDGGKGRRAGLDSN